MAAITYGHRGRHGDFGAYLLVEVQIMSTAWAAGFYDGEGCTTVHGNHFHPHRNCVQMSASQKTPECLNKFLAIVGVGSVTGPDRTGMYRWSVASTGGVWTAITAIWDELGTAKRDQFVRVFAKVMASK